MNYGPSGYFQRTVRIECCPRCANQFPITLLLAEGVARCPHRAFREEITRTEYVPYVEVFSELNHMEREHREDARFISGLRFVLGIK